MHVFAGSPDCGKAIIAGFLGVPLVSSTSRVLMTYPDDKRGQEGADSLMPFSLTASQSATGQSPRQAYDQPACYTATQPASRDATSILHIATQPASQPATATSQPASHHAASLSACQQAIATQPRNHAASLPWSQSVSQQSVYKPLANKPAILCQSCSLPLCQPISLYISQPAGQPASQPDIQPARQPASHPVSQLSTRNYNFNSSVRRLNP